MKKTLNSTTDEKTIQNPQILTVKNLQVKFPSLNGYIHAVRGIDLSIKSGDSIVIVGESGSGKSVTSRSLPGLIESPPAEISGNIDFMGCNIIGASDEKLRKVRGKGIGMVFQDSLDSLNPVYTIGSQLAENLCVGLGWSKNESWSEAVRLMTQVDIPAASERLNDYPHQLSGGMRQRICIAMAISMRPQLLIADEPTTALDVTVQAGILRLIKRLQRESNMALIFVTHDLSVARRIADKLVVMYAGRIVEQGPIGKIFARPAHPYTKALLNSHPGTVKHWTDLKPIFGRPPEKTENSYGCSFYPRCQIARNECLVNDPEIIQISEQHICRCKY